MSASIPQAGEVDKAIKAVLERVKASQKVLNQAAAKYLSRGNYSAAEELVGKGKEIQGFLKEVRALRQRWRGMRGKGEVAPVHPQTPLWRYYRPILQALVTLGGEAKRREITPLVGEIMDGAFQEGDRDGMARGRIRWQVMIQRARKPLVGQGWLAEEPFSPWCITPEGRLAAESADEDHNPEA